MTDSEECNTLDEIEKIRSAALVEEEEVAAMRKRRLEKLRYLVGPRRRVQL